VLGEFGDDPDPVYQPPVSQELRRHITVTKASGRSRIVLARYARNRRLADALERWAFCSLTHSPGARRYYDQLRTRGKTHHQARASSPTAGPASPTSASSANSSTMKPPPGNTWKPPLLDTFQPWGI
jgi:hypothetical protein